MILQNGCLMNGCLSLQSSLSDQLFFRYDQLLLKCRSFLPFHRHFLLIHSHLLLVKDQNRSSSARAHHLEAYYDICANTSW
uniref:Ovule protein n=1 Tax=Ditylenchus dipsaci TaxID=166011 RepID=A0A915DU77_9BILA